MRFFKLSGMVFVLLFAIFSFKVYGNTKEAEMGVYPLNSPVAIHGRLKVIGTQLCDESSKPIQLRGVSSHGLQWYGQFMNYQSITYMATNWKVDVIRAAMYTKEGGYLGNTSVKYKVEEIVQAAESNGIYCIIDWHILSDGNPNLYKKDALNFFTNMAYKYRAKKHVIYEICNEPNGSSVTWDLAIKPYAEYIIPEIRAIDPDSLIIVGTGEWSQRVDDAANNPLSYSNVLYAVHFYSGTHTQWLRDRVAAALSKIAIFCTEWGTSLASGTGGPYLEEAKRWIDFLNEKKISWCNWSLSDKRETSAMLKPDNIVNGGWDDDRLTQSGRFVRDQISNR